MGFEPDASCNQFRDALCVRGIGQSLIDQLPYAVFVKSLEGIVLAANRIFAQGRGFSHPSEVVGKSIEALYQNDHLLERMAEEERPLLAGTVERISFVAEKRHPLTGQLLILSTVTKELCRSEDGGVSGIATTIRDDTDIVKSAESLEIFQALADQAADPIYVLLPDAGFRFAYANEAAAKHFKTPLAELMQRRIQDFNTQLDDEKLKACWLDILENQNFSMATEHRDANGQMIPVEIHDHLLQFRGKQYLAVYVRNISKSLAMQRELQVAEERWRLTFTATDTGVWDWNILTDEVFYSDSYLQMLGYSAEEFGSGPQACMSRVHPDDLPKVEQAMEEYLSKRRPDYEVAFRLLAKNGNYIWIQAKGGAVWNDEGRLVRMVGNHINITRQKEIEAQLQLTIERERELNRLKDDFVTMISHEFRNPLTVILTSVELLEMCWETLKNEKRVDLLNSMRSGVDRIVSLVEEILVLRKIESGVLRFCPEKVVLDDILKKAKREAEEAHRRIERVRLDTSAAPAEFVGDTALLHHALLNLLTNAIKYSPPDQPVDITVVHQTPWLVFTVKDRGIGIPEADQPKLYDVFHRGSNVGTIPGTGVGMVIIKRCVTMHEGLIEYETEAGKGTAFTIKIPYCPAQ